MPLFMVDVIPEANFNDIYNVEFLFPMHITIEEKTLTLLNSAIDASYMATRQSLVSSRQNAVFPANLILLFPKAVPTLIKIKGSCDGNIVTFQMCEL